MKAMMILSQCIEIKTMLNEISQDVQTLICLVMFALMISALKIVYYHLVNTCHVKKIKHLLEVRKPYSTPISCSYGRLPDLPKIERVPGTSSVQKQESSSVEMTERHNNDGHNSSTDSIRKLRILEPNSPPSRLSKRRISGAVSPISRSEQVPDRRKNQIMPTELLV
jgi:hypothetical protein